MNYVSYLILFYANILLSVVILALTIYWAINEVDLQKRVITAVLFVASAFEIIILLWNLPKVPLSDVDYGLTLLLSKVVVKPPWLWYVGYMVYEMRAHAKFAAPHGGALSLTPRSKEFVDKNKDAHDKGKIDEAVDTAKELNMAQEAARKLTESAAREAKRP